MQVLVYICRFGGFESLDELRLELMIASGWSFSCIRGQRGSDHKRRASPSAPKVASPNRMTAQTSNE